MHKMPGLVCSTWEGEGRRPGGGRGVGGREWAEALGEIARASAAFLALLVTLCSCCSSDARPLYYQALGHRFVICGLSSECESCSWRDASRVRNEHPVHAEDQGLAPSIHTRRLATTCTANCRGSDDSPVTCTSVQIPTRGHTCIHIIKIIIFKRKGCRYSSR